MPNNKNLQKSGFSMIEVLVALTIMVIFGSAIISLTLTSISENTSAKLINQGVGFAEEGIEQSINQFQGLGFQRMLDLSSTGGVCYPDGTLTSAISCPINPPNCQFGQQISSSPFYRYVKVITSISQASIQVQSVVTWSERGICRPTEVDTYFYAY